MKNTSKLKLVETSHSRTATPLSHSAMAALLLEVHAGLLEDPQLGHLSDVLEDVLFELVSKANSSQSKALANPEGGSSSVKLTAV